MSDRIGSITETRGNKEDEFESSELGTPPKIETHRDMSGVIPPEENGAPVPLGGDKSHEQKLNEVLEEFPQDLRDNNQLAANLVRSWQKTGGTLEELQTHFSSSLDQASEGLPFSEEVLSAIRDEEERHSVIESITLVFDGANSSQDTIRKLLEDYEARYHESDELLTALEESVKDIPEKQKLLEEVKQELQKKSRDEQLNAYRAALKQQLHSDPALGERITNGIAHLNNPETKELLEKIGIPQKDWEEVLKTLQESLAKQDKTPIEPETKEEKHSSTVKQILGFGLFLLADTRFNGGYGTQQVLEQLFKDEFMFPTLKKFGFSEKTINKMRFSGYRAISELSRLSPTEFSNTFVELSEHQIYDFLTSLSPQERSDFVTKKTYKNAQLSSDAIEKFEEYIKTASTRDKKTLGVV